MARGRKTTKKRIHSNNTSVNTTDEPVAGPSQPVHRSSNKKKKTGEDKVAVSIESSNINNAALADVDDDGISVNDAPELVSALVNKVKQQEVTIKQLTQKVNFLMSYLGIRDDKVKPNSGVDLAVDDGRSSAGSTQQSNDQHADSDTAIITPADSLHPINCADVTARKPAPLSSALRQAVVSAVYRDFEDRDRRNSNVVVSGISSSDVNDVTSVDQVLQHEFGRSYGIVRCRRLGREIPGKIRPLLVTMQTVPEAQYLIQSAKQLRQSSNEYVRKFVFINADVTKAEAFAAYQNRCERRRRAANRPRDQQPPIVNNTSIDQLALSSAVVPQTMMVTAQTMTSSAVPPLPPQHLLPQQHLLMLSTPLPPMLPPPLLPPSSSLSPPPSSRIQSNDGPDR